MIETKEMKMISQQIPGEVPLYNMQPLSYGYAFFLRHMNSDIYYADDS